MASIEKILVGGTEYNICDSQNIAPVEASSTSANAYAVGDALIFEGQLYDVIQPIAVGNTLTVGTNIQATTVSGKFDSFTKYSISEHIIGRDEDGDNIYRRVFNISNIQPTTSGDRVAFNAINTTISGIKHLIDVKGSFTLHNSFNADGAQLAIDSSAMGTGGTIQYASVQDYLANDTLIVTMTFLSSWIGSNSNLNADAYVVVEYSK